MQKKNTATPHGKPPALSTYTVRRGDIMLVAGFLILSLLLFLGYPFFFRSPGASVEISIEGTVTKVLPLNQDTTYEITTGKQHKNTLQIKDGYASVSHADCPDKLCVRQKKINKKGETLVCLPHKVIITVISSQEEKEYDGIAN